MVERCFWTPFFFQLSGCSVNNHHFNFMRPLQYSCFCTAILIDFEHASHHLTHLVICNALPRHRSLQNNTPDEQTCVSNPNEPENVPWLSISLEKKEKTKKELFRKSWKWNGKMEHSHSTPLTPWSLFCVLPALFRIPSLWIQMRLRPCLLIMPTALNE